MKLKKLLSFSLACVMALALMVPAWANDTTLDISQLAQKEIQITTNTCGDESVVNTYSNLQGFAEVVRSAYPDMSMEEIATYILEFTGQDSAAIPADEVPNILQYDTISTSSQILNTNKSGNIVSIDANDATNASWTSTDGSMRIVTSYSLTKTNSDGDRYYDVWATASWLKMPAVSLRDAFGIGTSAAYDDDATLKGSVNQAFTCSVCKQIVTESRNISRSKQTDGDLTLDFSNRLPALKFDVLSPYCENGCTNNGYSTSFNAYIRFGVCRNDTADIQASYGHQTFGRKGISVSVSSSGALSFGTTFGGKVVPYDAEPILLKS